MPDQTGNICDHCEQPMLLCPCGSTIHWDKQPCYSGCGERIAVTVGPFSGYVPTTFQVGDKLLWCGTYVETITRITKWQVEVEADDGVPIVHQMWSFVRKLGLGQYRRA